MPIDVDHRDIWNKIRRAEATLRKRKAQGKQERRAIRRAAGGPCKATTKLGRPCRRRAMANGVCLTHGGRDVMQLWLAGQRLEAEREQQAETALAVAISEAAEHARLSRPPQAMQSTHDEAKPA